MFTGIVECMGSVNRLHRRLRGISLTISAPTILTGTRLGDSVCVSGVCLTVTGISDGAFSCDVVAETLNRTTLGYVTVGDFVNLERSLCLDTRLGGHLVMGHVDGVGTVTTLSREGDSVRLGIAYPQSVARYIVEKGCIAVDGVSLTVVSVSEAEFSVALIPHTHKTTTLSQVNTGSRVNLEVDIIAKYVEKLVRHMDVDERHAPSDTRIRNLLEKQAG